MWLVHYYSHSSLKRAEACVSSSFSWLHPSTNILPPYRLHWSYTKWKVSAGGLQGSLPQLSGEGGGRQGRRSSWEMQALRLHGRSDGRMCMCVPHSPAMASHHWGITGNPTRKQLKGGERDPSLLLPLHGVSVQDTMWVTASTERATGTWGDEQVVPHWVPVTRFLGEYLHFFWPSSHLPLTCNAQRRFLLFSSVVYIFAGYMLQNCLLLFCFAPRMKKAQNLGHTRSYGLIFWVTVSILQYSH